MVYMAQGSIFKVFTALGTFLWCASRKLWALQPGTWQCAAQWCATVQWLETPAIAGILCFIRKWWSYFEFGQLLPFISISNEVPFSDLIEKSWKCTLVHTD